jgi:hypothetical protein
VKHADTLAPVAAAVTALTTLVCCLPVGFATAAAAASVSVVAAEYQWWFLGLSVALLGVGVVQLRRVHRACSTHRVRSTVVFCVSAAVVLMVILFPQTIAGLAADWLP